MKQFGDVNEVTLQHIKHFKNPNLSGVSIHVSEHCVTLSPSEP